MQQKTETFESIIESFQYKHDLRSVFDDFLTMTLCAFSFNPLTGKSQQEELYLETIAKYKKEEGLKFPNLLATLTNEMEERLSDSQGNDVLGDYYGNYLYRKGAQQYFTPWHVCMFMAECACGESKKVEQEKPLRILDPCCGSGRMLLASGRINGPRHEYYGIDIDSTCVKMTAINLFLNGMFHSEVMCADALVPEDFNFSYRISFLPFGIFKVEKKEDSLLWHLSKESFKKPVPENDLVLPSEEQNRNKNSQESAQLTFF
jgi:type I restriction-modification system DNA methylase subunit